MKKFLILFLLLTPLFTFSQTSGRFTFRIAASGNNDKVSVAERGMCLGFASILLDQYAVVVEVYEFDEKGLAKQEPNVYFATGKIERNYEGGMEKCIFTCMDKTEKKALAGIVISYENDKIKNFTFHLKYEDGKMLMYEFIE